MAPNPGKKGKGTGRSYPGVGGKSVPGVQGFVPKSKVIAQFVDEIPPDTSREDNLVRFVAQEGVVEGLELARSNPGRALLLVEYVVGSPSKRRNDAKMRAVSLINRGFSEAMGWTVRAVENKVYVMYDGGES